MYLLSRQPRCDGGVPVVERRTYHSSPVRHQSWFATLTMVVAAAVSMLCSTSTAQADTYTFPTFNLTATNSIGSIALTGAPTGVSYSTYSVSFNWTAGSGDPYSEEAIWAFVNSPPPQSGSTVFYADPSSSPDSAGNGDSVTLTWNASFDTPYVGGNPLFFWNLQTFTGSQASWGNISITFDTAGLTPPPATLVGTPSTTNGTLGAGEIDWYQVNYAGGGLVLDTLGSLLSPDNDTEIGLYDVAGALIDTNDDIDFSGGNLLSSLTFADGDLAPGTYYVAVGAFNSTFATGFGASSTATNVGSYILNVGFPGAVATPEPGSLALLGIALSSVGVVIARRRKIS